MDLVLNSFKILSFITVFTRNPRVRKLREKKKYS